MFRSIEWFYGMVLFSSSSFFNWYSNKISAFLSLPTFLWAGKKLSLIAALRTEQQIKINWRKENKLILKTSKIQIYVKGNSCKYACIYTVHHHHYRNPIDSKENMILYEVKFAYSLYMQHFEKCFITYCMINMHSVCYHIH